MAVRRGEVSDTKRDRHLREALIMHPLETSGWFSEDLVVELNDGDGDSDGCPKLATSNLALDPNPIYSISWEGMYSLPT